MGRERPRLRIAHAAPRLSGGVAHAPRHCRRCAGARVWLVGEMPVKTLPFSRKMTVGNDPECCLRIDRIPGPHLGRFAVAPVLNFPGALGRVKGSLAPLAAVAPLTRPARSRTVCNYRSDGTIERSDRTFEPS